MSACGNKLMLLTTHIKGNLGANNVKIYTYHGC